MPESFSGYAGTNCLYDRMVCHPKITGTGLVAVWLLFIYSERG
jgi:hypothetical protein